MFSSSKVLPFVLKFQLKVFEISVPFTTWLFTILNQANCSAVIVTTVSEFSLYVPLRTETLKLSLIFLSSAVIEIVSTIALFDSLISFVLLVKVGVLFSPASFIVISCVALTPAESVTVIVYTTLTCSPAPRKSIFA